MEQKLVKVPFDIELAKKITNGEIEGRIFDDYYKCSVRIVDFNFLSSKGKFNVAISERGEGKEVYSVFNDEGIIYLDREDKLDETPVFMLEIPEHMAFKEGDILYARVKNGNWYVFIYRDNGKDKTFFYAAIDDNGRLWIEYNYITSNDCISELRFATEEEKQILVERLKASKEPKAKECLKMLGVEVKPECEFKPFDKVIVRDGDRDKWEADFFSHKIEDNSFPYICVSDSYKYCIPYNEKTAHLIGTTGGWEE